MYSTDVLNIEKGDIIAGIQVDDALLQTIAVFAQYRSTVPGAGVFLFLSDDVIKKIDRLTAFSRNAYYTTQVLDYVYNQRGVERLFLVGV